MGKKTQGRKTGQRAQAPQAPDEFRAGSLRSQRSIKQQWRLESALKTAKELVAMWERNLTKAKEGVARNAVQLSAGNSASHRAMEGYVEDVVKAEKMIAAFESQVTDLQAQLDALIPNAVQAAERAEAQRSLRTRVLARLELDRKLDAALGTVRKILQQRSAATSEMREDASALEFESNVNLDDQRFADLLLSLPSGMALESQAWVKWFFGSEENRSSCEMRYGNAVLSETLASHNAFRSGDCPMLTKAEEAEIDRIIDSQRPPRPPDEEMRSALPSPEPVPSEKIQWMLAR